MRISRIDTATFSTCFLIALAAPAAAISQEAPAVRVLSSDLGEVVLGVEMEMPTLEAIETPLGGFTRISCDGCGVTTRVGAPLLPVVREHLEIPRGARVSLRVVEASYEDLDLAALGLPARVAPAQPSIPKIPGAREAMPFAFDPAAFAQDRELGGAAAVLGGIGTVRAHRFVEVELFPVAHNPATGSLRRLVGATIVVSFEGADLEATSRALRRYASPSFDRLAARRFPNHRDFAALSKAKLALPIGYLVIAHDDFVDEVAPFAALKHALGYRATVVPLSETGGQTAAHVAAYIENAYATWDVPPTFVLLVGDTGQIPCFEGEEYGEPIATDLFFATMEGGDDWLPDLHIGRFSCDSAAEVTRLVEKTIDYTLYSLAESEDWIKRATFMASQDNNEVSEGTHDYVIDAWLEPDGYDCAKRYSVTYGATTQQVIDDIEAGLSQLTYSGHGAEDGWYDGPPLDSGQVAALGNAGMYPVVQSYACLTGAFDGPCFAEEWTTASAGGVLFFGSSINSLWDEDDILERGVYEAWYGADPHTWIRGAFDEGLWDVYEHYSGGDNTRAYFQQYNVFGDPSLDPWTDVPGTPTLAVEPAPRAGDQSLAAAVFLGGDAPVAGALVCVRRADDIYATGYTDSDGALALDLGAALEEGDVLDIGVGGHNLVPLFEAITVEAAATDTDADSDSDSDADADADAGEDSGAPPVTVFNPGSSGCGCRASGETRARASLLRALAGVLP